MAFAELLGIPEFAPVKEQPFGFVWLVLVLISFLVLACFGALLGLFLNVLILRFVLRWDWQRIRAVGALPQRPIASQGRPVQPGQVRGEPLYDPLLDCVAERPAGGMKRWSSPTGSRQRRKPGR